LILCFKTVDLFDNFRLYRCFKAKTAVIFEAAVKSKIVEEINRLETEYQEQLDEEIQSTKEDLVEKVDSYLNYVVETWVEDNKLAIQSGLRTEIAENFMEKMKDLFTESYVDIPESKIDLVDELATANEELEEQYNEAVAKSMTLQEELSNYKREAIIREASKDLAETQVEKLTKLAESIEFESAEDFAAKVATLKESYFKDKSASSPISEEVDDDNDPIEITGSMADYVAALRKTIK
jgi:mRNA-degrading endonuclease RelE of RelBE toxin-antitoxin system